MIKAAILIFINNHNFDAKNISHFHQQLTSDVLDYMLGRRDRQARLFYAQMLYIFHLYFLKLRNPGMELV